MIRDIAEQLATLAALALVVWFIIGPYPAIVAAAIGG